MSRKSTSTRNAIKKALITCVSESEATGPVSIVEIAEATGINRATFYYHYGSLEELIDDLEFDFVAALQNRIHSAIKVDERNYGPFIDAVADDLEKNKDFLVKFGQRMPKLALGDMRSKLSKNIAEILRPYYKEGEDSALQLEILIGGYLARLFVDFYNEEIPSRSKVRSEMRLLIDAIASFASIK